MGVFEFVSVISSGATVPGCPNPASAELEDLGDKRVSASLRHLVQPNALPKREPSQVGGLHIVSSLQVLLEVVLPGPVLGFVFARTQITAIDGLVFSGAEIVDTSLMPVKVILCAESLDRSRAARNVALEGLLVPGLVFPSLRVS